MSKVKIIIPVQDVSESLNGLQGRPKAMLLSALMSSMITRVDISMMLFNKCQDITDPTFKKSMQPSNYDKYNKKLESSLNKFLMYITGVTFFSAAITPILKFSSKVKIWDYLKVSETDYISADHVQDLLAHILGGTAKDDASENGFAMEFTQSLISAIPKYSEISAVLEDNQIVVPLIDDKGKVNLYLIEDDALLEPLAELGKEIIEMD